jgi:hypothetical protein
MSRPLCMTELIAVADFRLQSKSPANSVLKSPANSVLAVAKLCLINCIQVVNFLQLQTEAMDIELSNLRLPI